MNPDVEIKGGQLLCWPTPVLEAMVPDAGALNADLLDIIHHKARTSAGVRTTNRGAWQSESDFLKTDHPAVVKLSEAIYQAVCALGATLNTPVADITAEAWAVIYRNGHFQSAHTHPGAAWSGVYYVACATAVAGPQNLVDAPGQGAEAQGCIEFMDPRTGHSAASGQTSTFAIRPRNGLIICFPSWLEHWVRPVVGDEERVCIPFNAGYA